MRKPPYVASFDSATAMTQALARCLAGRDFPMLGVLPAWMAPVMKLVAAVVNAAPKRAQEWVYRFSGAREALPLRRLREASTERISQWLVDLYPQRKYPAVMIGSSDGALVHLAALFGIPWLPQTCLVPVRRTGVDPDDAQADLEWAREPARIFLEANPDVQLHQLCDPSQDRLMIQHMSYFRFKRLRLGRAYERFLQDSLEPGGTVFIVDCRLRWPVTRLGERYVFQFGAVGGPTLHEYFHGGERVAAHLARHGSSRRRWTPPAPNAQAPEAEWGFEPALAADVRRLAAKHGWHVRTISYDAPEDLSPRVADLYSRWNARRGVKERRLLAESFIVMEPYWTMRTGAIPFWMVFNMEPSARALERYLRERGPFDEVGIMLFSHGVDSVGLARAERWQRLGQLIGVDAHAYPRDFGVFVRYHYALRERFASRYPLGAPLPLSELEPFCDAAQARSPTARV